MRPVGLAIHVLRVPFVEGFAHAAHDRTASDAVVVRVVAEDGTVGHGEGLARPYVTGETTEAMVAHVADALWPLVAGRALPTWTPAADAGWLPDAPAAGGVVPHAARAALELALVDASLRAAGRGVGEVLPPVRRQVAYGGVITAGEPAKAERLARQMKLAGLATFKVKVGLGDDAARLAAVRGVIGPGAELRLDANGAWPTPEAAAEALAALAPFAPAMVEQPLPRGPVADLRRLRGLTPVPIMADESVVTEADAVALIAAGAVDAFNVRVSKNGGLGRAAAIARLAADAGLGVQVGAQVGETALLAAAGRHLACAVPTLRWAEGSFGTLLLVEDVAREPVRFGHRGLAGAIAGPGLGVAVRDDVLRKYAVAVVTRGVDA